MTVHRDQECVVMVCGAALCSEHDTGAKKYGKVHDVIATTSLELLFIVWAVELYLFIDRPEYTLVPQRLRI